MQDDNSQMLLQTIKQVDLIYSIFLGRLPEDNFVRADNLGRPVLELVKAMIGSEEFKQSILERFSLYGRLPHRQISLRLLPDALELIAEAELAGPHHGAALRIGDRCSAACLATCPAAPPLKRLTEPRAVG